MIPSHSIYMAEKIVDYEASESYLYLMTDAGGRFSIPLRMLGHFRDPYAPDNGAEMLILHDRPVVDTVEVTNAQLIVHFVDGRTISVPLTWFPRLLHGTLDERNDVEILHGDLLHWEALDEDIDATTLFKMTGPSAEGSASLGRWLAERTRNTESATPALSPGTRKNLMPSAMIMVRETSDAAYRVSNETDAPTQ